jgi:hypothetical protein
MPSPGTYTYEMGDQISLNATPAPGYVFSYWLFQDGSQISNFTTTLTLAFSQTAVAVFTQQSDSATSQAIYIGVVVSFFLVNTLAYIAVLRSRHRLRSFLRL